jgi:hypothetical protein
MRKMMVPLMMPKRFLLMKSPKVLHLQQQVQGTGVENEKGHHRLAET